ncbi:MAG: HNH endonuclease [bacterium]|nr:HNH endonuclease [bacterium]
MLTEFRPDRPASEADSALRCAFQAEETARKCAVLWFADILERRLFRELGYSSMQQYARRALGFSESRVSDFMHLARKLDKLPAVKAALPEIGYTKARQIVRVASPRTAGDLVEAARTTGRRELAKKVRRVVKRARKTPAAELFAVAESESESELAAEVPVRLGLEFSPEQHARWEALWERLKKTGVTGSREDVLLKALACKLEDISNTETTASTETASRLAVPPVQIHVYECPTCGAMETNGKPLGPADAERIRCDAAISTPTGRNTTSIPPRTRRLVLARDRHRCQAPGCSHTKFLEIHHRDPRTQGGTNAPSNLITLCSSCHRLWHSNHVRE